MISGSFSFTKCCVVVSDGETRRELREAAHAPEEVRSKLSEVLAHEQKPCRGWLAVYFRPQK